MGVYKDKFLWKFYYRYKSIGDVDVEGSYSFFQRFLIFLKITKVNLFGDYLTPKLLEDKVEMSPDKISQIIYNTLSSNNPCMIARFGANEQRITANYIAIKTPPNILKAICGRQPFWWWDKQVRREFTGNAGFFPDETTYIERYSEHMIEDSKSLDVLLTWFGWESLLVDAESSKISFVGLQEAEPWWQKNPWTRYLEGKRVLVVHPYAELIRCQYKNREKLFSNKSILPAFELITLKAVQSIGGGVDGFDNWFDALKWMEDEMDKIDYDVALIGCGAYGFCLAAHAKRSGKKAVHLGGALQLLFGIKGNRWEDKNYHPLFDYTTLFNSYWVKPGDTFRPDNAEQFEGACYW